MKAVTRLQSRVVNALQLATPPANFRARQRDGKLRVRQPATIREGIRPRELDTRGGHVTQARLRPAQQRAGDRLQMRIPGLSKPLRRFRGSRAASARRSSKSARAYQSLSSALAVVGAAAAS